jgi:hypothetical protein
MSYEYHQLLEHVYFGGYVDSYEDAESLLEQMSDEELSNLYESVFRGRSSGAASADAADRAAEMHKTAADAPGTSTSNRKRHRDAAARSRVTARRMRRKEKEETNEDYVIDYLISEGYTDNYNAAIEIYEAMSEEWLYSILEVKGGGKVPFRGDTSGRGMPLNPSTKLGRKRIKLEVDMENEEERIRRRHGAGDGEHDDYTQSDDWRPERVSRGERRRRGSAKREIENSPKMKKLQSRWERLSDVANRN